MKTRSGCVTSNIKKPNIKKPKLKTIWLHPKGRRPPPRRRTTLLRHCPRRRRSSSDNFGKTLPNLPFDIQLNIISRFSVKLIVACKSLSKAFNHSISQPSFTHIYRDNNYNPSSSLNPIFINSSNITSIYLVESEDIDLELVEFQRDVYTYDNPIISKGTCFSSATLPGSLRGDPDRYDAGSSIWGQCNGLFCLLKLDFNILNLFLTNPLSGEFIKLPDPVVLRDERYWWEGIMAYGLGYCQTTERFKVLRTVTTYFGGGVTNYDTKTEILTIGVDQNWRNVSDVNVPFNIKYNHDGPNPQLYMVAFRSALHWMAQPIPMHDGFEIEPKRGGKIHIAAFDMTEEKVFALPFPPEVGCPDFFGMGVLMDKLCLWDLMIQTDDINIWIMDEYGVEGSWTKQFKIKFSRLPPGFVQVRLMVLSISVHDGVILLSDLQRLVYYDLKMNYSLMCIHLVNKYNRSYPMPFVPDFVSFRNRQGWIADVV